MINFDKRIMIAFSALLSLTVSERSLATPNVSSKDKDAIFAAAGFKNLKGAWQGKCSFGAISLYQDLNADQLLDAVIKDGGTVCYPKTGVGFYLLTQQSNQKWKVILRSPGEPKFLRTKGSQGWPDIEIVDSTKCRSILRWNGTQYLKHRNEYMNMACQDQTKPKETVAKNPATKTTTAENAKLNSPAGVKPSDKTIKATTKQPPSLELSKTLANEKANLPKSIDDEAKRIQQLESQFRKSIPAVQTPKPVQPSEHDIKSFKTFEEASKSSKTLDDEKQIFKAFEGN